MGFVTKKVTPQEYVQVDDLPWVPFPSTLCEGSIRWKLLHVSPELGSWTAVFDCPKGSSFNAHFHIGPGEYILTRGRMDVRGGRGSGGSSAKAPGYGYEAANARHDKTYFLEDSEFYMSFIGPLEFITPDAKPIALVGWKEVQDAWEASLAAQKKKKAA